MATAPLPLNAFLAVHNDAKASEPFWCFVKHCMDHASESIRKDSTKWLGSPCLGTHVTLMFEGNGVCVVITHDFRWQFQVRQSSAASGRVFTLSPACATHRYARKTLIYDCAQNSFESLKLRVGSDAFDMVAEPVGQTDQRFGRILPRLLRSPSDAIALVADACWGQRPKLSMRIMAYNDAEHVTSLDAIKHLPMDAFGMLGDVFDVPSPCHSDWYTMAGHVPDP